MILAVASGKGGTGKTTLCVNVARSLNGPVQLFDCDVEEPNAHLFLRGSVCMSEPVSVPIPKVDESACNGCGECSRFCQYHAIALIKNTLMIFPNLCHSCGGCVKVCPQQVITESQKKVGVIEAFESGGIRLIQGRLDIGTAMATPLIRAVKARIRPNTLAILDAPPGTSCPVIATVQGSDAVVLVTEPTPFGLHDLELAVDMVRLIGIPFGVVVNRIGIGDGRVHDFCRQECIPILLEIPDDRKIAEICSRGDLIVDELPEYRSLFEGFLEKVTSLQNASGKTILKTNE